MNVPARKANRALRSVMLKNKGKVLRSIINHLKLEDVKWVGIASQDSVMDIKHVIDRSDKKIRVFMVGRANYYLPFIWDVEKKVLKTFFLRNKYSEDARQVIDEVQKAIEPTPRTIVESIEYKDESQKYFMIVWGILWVANSFCNKCSHYWSTDSVKLATCVRRFTLWLFYKFKRLKEGSSVDIVGFLKDSYEIDTPKEDELSICS